MKNIFFLLFILFAAVVSAQPWKAHGPLQVSKENPHYLAHHDGTPFFWLADTGWEMLHRLNREEMELTLKTAGKKDLTLFRQ
jgi:hypothetical protein